MRSRRDRRRKGRTRSPAGDLYTIGAIASTVLGAIGGLACYLGGVSLLKSFLVFFGVFLGGAVVSLLIEKRRVLGRLESLLAAGEFAAARRLAERGERVLGKDPRFAKLREMAELGETLPEARSEAGEAAAPPPLAPSAEEVIEEPRVPADRVVTGRGLAAIALMVPACLPVVGVLFAPALLIVSLLLLKGRKLRWDRPVALIGLVLGGLILAVNAVGVAVVALGTIRDLDFPERNLGDWPLRVIVVQIVVLVFSIILHECAHAAAARIAGDDTAERAGRLTLNPVRHVDPFGSLILPVVLSAIGGVVFGWAKPVPVSPSRFRHPRRGDAFVSAAGILTNLVLAFVAGGLLLLIAFVLSRAEPGRTVGGFANLFVTVDLPLPLALLVEALKAAVWVNLLLATFNFLPIPPLDGFHALLALFPKGAAAAVRKASGLGMIALVVLVYTGAIGVLLAPAWFVAFLLVAIPGALVGS